MGLHCRDCRKVLSRSFRAERAQLKSCPDCSARARVHVFYPYEDFGTCEQRKTPANPDGIQSWCENCRAVAVKGTADASRRNQGLTAGDVPSGGVRCNETGELVQLWLLGGE